MIRELDPVGTALQWRGNICRRKYNVRCPNALWHIDGNHKMIRWGLLYTRLLMDIPGSYHMCTVQIIANQIQYLTCFRMPANHMAYFQEFNRSDHGLESMGVARMMLECRGVNRGSIITGSSVYNQRVQRLHKDVASGVLKVISTNST